MSVAVALGAVNTIASGLAGMFGGKKTIAAPGEVPGLIRLAQDGGRFTLSETTEVIVIAPSGAQASKVLPAGSYEANKVLGYDLQKGASKAYYRRASAEPVRAPGTFTSLPTGAAAGATLPPPKAERGYMDILLGAVGGAAAAAAPGPELATAGAPAAPGATGAPSAGGGLLLLGLLALIVVLFTRRRA